MRSVNSYLSAGREAARERRLVANTRALLALEVRSNRVALATFWRTVTALATSQPASDGTPAEPVKPGSWEELAAMYAGDLVSYTLPTWSTIRWHALEPRTVAALSDSEVTKLDSTYRALRDITDLYRQVATISAEYRAELQKNVGGRFWNLDLARDRQALYTRLRAAVARVLDVDDPLPGVIVSGK
jgi:hypothetical protein